VTNRNLNGLVRCCAVHRIGPFWVGRSARVACTNGTDIRAGKPPGLKSRSQNKMSLFFGVNTAVKSVALAGRALLESQANVGTGKWSPVQPRASQRSGGPFYRTLTRQALYDNCAVTMKVRAMAVVQGAELVQVTIEASESAKSLKQKPTDKTKAKPKPVQTRFERKVAEPNRTGEAAGGPARAVQGAFEQEREQ
jgi:hypothetical protein